jgi:hypothetical protein
VSDQPIINDYKLATCMIDGFPIDATVSENHEHEAEVTEFPVEKGADTTDNRRRKNLRVTMEGIVSDTPLGAIARHQTRQSGIPSDTAYAKLIALDGSDETVTIVSSKGVFKNMLMTSLEFPAEGAEPHQLHFRAQFKQVNFVTNNRTTIRVATPAGVRGPLVTGATLAKLGNMRILVFTLKAKDPRRPSYPLILVEKNGDRHYETFPGVFGTPKPDGAVESDGYHPFDAFGATLDGHTGQWNYKGKPVTARPNASKTDTSNGWHEFTAGMTNF